jgi:hypothetical protein
MSDGYDYTREQLAELIVRMQFPERSAAESAIIAAFLQVHLLEYDRYSITVRVGEGVPPNPDHLEGVQRQTRSNSQMRIDLMTWRGAQPFIFEVKGRANHHAIGQLFTYRHLWMKENPDAPVPQLAVLARAIEPDMPDVYAAAGITVYLYPEAAGDGGATGRGLSADDGETA